MKVVYVDFKTKLYIDSLGVEEQAKFASLRELLEKYGYALRMPYSKKVCKDIFELRGQGNIKVRIFYTYRFHCAIILHAFIKKTNKLPQKEINTALHKLKMFDNI